MIRRSVEILDTTLRDGAQAEGISFSVNDKFQVVETLAALGVRYIEAGNPGSNPKDREFYNRFRSNPPDMAGSRLAAFGSTRRKNSLAEEDANLAVLCHKLHERKAYPGMRAHFTGLEIPDRY
ncbi:MAG: hypothetical protein PHG76_10065, partial [Eubacteriales bacterium]|nr:hypothetical protein [Eubacteriales bacterium]